MIGDIRCNGDINANISATTTSAFSAANVNLVRSVNGSITGNIQAPNGQVGAVEATSGAIGASGDLSTILSANFINTIRAGTIHANIHGPLSGGNPTAGPGFALIKATSGGLHGSILQTDTSGGAGERGLLVTGGLNSNVQFTCCPGNPITIAGGINSSGNLSIAGDCSSDLTIDSLPAGKTTTIGGSLLGDLNIGAAGLTGQIVVNGTNASETWQSPAVAFVGAIELSPLPDYDHCSMVLGNGAVGLVPFALYDNDCMPPNDAGSPRSVGETNFYTGGQVISARFYGPVKVASGTNPATGATIEKFNGSTWDDVTSGFLLAFSAPNGVHNRSIDITDAPGVTDTGTGSYRVRPKSSGGAILLKCDTAGTPPVADFEYRFEIVTGCYDPSTDFNDDGFNDPDDLGDYINCYFASPPCEDADFNGDSHVDPDDLGDFINAYFAPGC